MCVGYWPWPIHTFPDLFRSRLSRLAEVDWSFFGFHFQILLNLRHITGLCTHAKVLLLLARLMLTQDVIMKHFLSLSTNFSKLFQHLHFLLTTIISTNGFHGPTTSGGSHCHQWLDWKDSVTHLQPWCFEKQKPSTAWSTTCIYSFSIHTTTCSSLPDAECVGKHTGLTTLVSTFSSMTIGLSPTSNTTMFLIITSPFTSNTPCLIFI